jgi:hypothetical protein
MESYFGDIKDKIVPNHENTIKIKFIYGKNKDMTQSTLEKTNLTQNTFSLFSNETNERTIIREKQKDLDTNLKKEDKDNKISSIQYNPSLPPSDLKVIVEPIIFSSSCASTISNFGDVMMNDNSVNQSTNSVSPTYINFLPEVKYNPVPEREYYDDILSGLLIEEKTNSDYKKCLYIEYQKDLDNKKRASLISFIYQMSKVYNFKSRTTFLAVQVMDRFFCKEKIDSVYFDLLCICSLVIASKFNEIYYPAFKDIIGYFAKEKNYTVKQALTMELLILRTIDYNLFPIFPMFFFDIIAQKTDLNNTEYYLGCLMIELIQFDFFLYPFKNSILAQSVFCKVVTLTERKNYNPLQVLKNIFPDENFDMDSENVNLIQKALIVIDELLHHLDADYFTDIYQKYSQQDILGKSINYFLNM